jgi:hypothetical protein
VREEVIEKKGQKLQLIKRERMRETVREKERKREEK